MGDVGAEFSRTMKAGRVAARELAHQHRAFLFAKTLDDKMVVFEHAVTLFFQGWIRRDRGTTQRRGRLSKKPWASEARTRDHHAIDVVSPKGFDDRLGRCEVTVSDQGDFP